MCDKVLRKALQHVCRLKCHSTPSSLTDTDNAFDTADTQFINDNYSQRFTSTFFTNALPLEFSVGSPSWLVTGGAGFTTVR